MTTIFFMIRVAAALLLFCISTAVAQSATLAQKWNISEEVSSRFSGEVLKVGYTVSDYISNYDWEGAGMARFSIYDQHCEEEGVIIVANDTSGIETIQVDTTDLDDPPQTGLNMDREVIVTVQIDPEMISDNPLLYSEYSDIDSPTERISAQILFCFRFGLHTKSGTSVEVNILESIVTVDVDITDGFEILSVVVEPRDRLFHTANQVYLVNAFLCDSSNTPIPKDDPFSLGTVIRVCVEPDDEALDDGIRMRSIDDFTWMRSSPKVVNQPCIVGPNQVARNGMTKLDCVPGSRICSFETIMFALFYTSNGTVMGDGVASMQFGTGQDDVPAAAAEFELDFDVAQATLVSSESPSISPNFTTCDGGKPEGCDDDDDTTSGGCSVRGAHTVFASSLFVVVATVICTTLF